MKFKLEINLDNTAFEHDVDRELKDILSKIVSDARSILHGYSIPSCICQVESSAKIKDSNGNTVGSMVIVED